MSYVTTLDQVGEFTHTLFHVILTQHKTSET